MTNNNTFDDNIPEHIVESYYQTSRPHLAGDAGEPQGVLTVTLRVTEPTNGSNQRFLTLFVSTVDENGQLEARWCYYFNDNTSYSCSEAKIREIESYNSEPLDQEVYDHYHLNYFNEYNFDTPANRYSFEEFLEQLWVDSYMN